MGKEGEGDKALRVADGGRTPPLLCFCFPNGEVRKGDSDSVCQLGEALAFSHPDGLFPDGGEYQDIDLDSQAGVEGAFTDGYRKASFPPMAKR
ncbi:MAG: hypothetical protein ABIF09_10185 [Gemmatimonadota bacterium]